jgi:hypothetical protein
MRPSDTISLVAASVALLLAAGVTRAFHLWSVLGNHTVPWFCGALAVALLLVVLTAVLTGCRPGAIPVSRMLVILVGSSVTVGLGMAIDGMSYGVSGDWASSLGEWAGFTLMLAALFWIPRLRNGRTGDSPADRPSPDGGPSDAART